MIKINLLPVRAAQKKESIRQQIAVLILILVVVLVGIVYVHMSMHKKIVRIEKSIAKYNEEIVQLKRKTGEVEDFKRKRRELLEKLNVIETLSKNKTGPVMILDMFSQIIPEKLWFNILKQTGRRLDIEGVALDNETIAVFFASLKRSPYFKGVELIHTQQIDYEGYKLTSFRLTCDVDMSSIKVQ